MPDEAGYRVWREAMELSVVSNSGRQSEAKVFVAEIAQFDPVYLAQNCPENMKGVEAKLALAIRLVMKGACCLSHCS